MTETLPCPGCSSPNEPWELCGHDDPLCTGGCCQAEHIGRPQDEAEDAA